MEIILASGSPRRKEILEQVGISFSVLVSQKEEIITKIEPQDVVKELSLIKATDVAKRIEYDAMIIGADTVVAYEKRILGKPKNEKDAIAMIESLQGREHSVFTGVSMLKKKNGKIEKEISFSVETKVKVVSMSKEEIRAYVKTKEPMDKAGAYAIQGRFASYISSLHGDYYNVVGLPISPIYEILKEEDCL